MFAQVRMPWLTWLLAGLSAAVFAALGAAPEHGVYDRFAVAGGEVWRLLSGHWMHGDTGHLAWNLGALLILGGIVETHSRLVLLLGLLVGSLAVDGWLWFLVPGMRQYCGLSGVLNTLLVLALAILWRRGTRGSILGIGGASMLKILLEIAGGGALITQTAWVAVPAAHLAGWLAGAALVAVAASAGWFSSRTIDRRGRGRAVRLQ